MGIGDWTNKVEFGSQTVIWRLLPTNHFLEKLTPNDDLYSDVFELADETKWQLCVRPCSWWPNGASSQPSEAQRIFRSANLSENWLGLWLQHRDDLDHKRVQAAYSLSLQSSDLRDLASHQDMWMPEYQNELRGSYWFVSLDEIEKKTRPSGGGGPRLTLQVVLSLAFDSVAGRATPVRVVADPSRPKDTLLRVGDRTVAIHASLLMGSKPLKTLLNKGRSRSGHQGMKVCDLSNLATDPSVLQAFTELLYTPCSSKIAHLPTQQIRLLYALLQKLEMSFHSKLVLRALKQIRHLNKPRDVADSYVVAGHDATWMKCFWAKICQWLMRQPHHWIEFVTNHRPLIIQALLQNRAALELFTSNRNSLFGNNVDIKQAADTIVSDPCLMRSFALSVVKPPPTCTAAA